MNNRIEVAREFAEAINCDKIEKIILFGSVALVMIMKIQILIF